MDRKINKNLIAYQNLYTVIKKALWKVGTVAADKTVYEELKFHTVAALAAPILPELNLSKELFREWEKACVRAYTNYHRCLFAQNSLPVTVPYVILKGTSAAQYYPHPEYRAMGDIDIMTRREDFHAACDMLLNNGFEENMSAEFERHREFSKQRILVEVHSYFASLNDPCQAMYLDDLIIENINPTHVLPDAVNGLVLLEHISQHLEHGLGLRQIIDWMMFVDKCLPDEKWPEFRVHAQKTGLETLAQTATRMCEIYLGLSQHSWCAGADESLCTQLMDYVMSCGNFGSKWTEDDSRVKLITYSRTPRAALKLFQEEGLKNWEAASHHRALRPFAWVYQAGHYLKKGLSQDGTASTLKAQFHAARQRNALFDALEIKQRSKGLVVYRDGKYVKK